MPKKAGWTMTRGYPAGRKRAKDLAPPPKGPSPSSKKQSSSQTGKAR